MIEDSDPTIRQALEFWLFSNGLFDDQTRHVFDLFIERLKAEGDDYMPNRTHCKVSDYPPMLIQILKLRIGPTIMKWFDDHAPKHWARALFTELCGLEPRDSEDNND